MNALSQTLHSVRLGEPRVHRNLAMSPLFGRPDGGDPFYLRLEEAMRSGEIHITETSEAGAVPVLKLRNGAPRPVLLLDGEELIGCKQNRVINVSILAPAGSTIEIPVACVEHGRWAWHSTAFSVAAQTQYATGRARRVAQVSTSLMTQGRFAADQLEVWAELAEKQSRFGVRSRTGAMDDLYAARERELHEYVSALVAHDGEIGALFAINGEIAGLEMFDHPRSLAAYLPKLVRGYALDAIDYFAPACPQATAAQAAALLPALERAATTSFPGVGLGENLRLECGADIVGAGLVHDGRLVHLCVFRSLPGGYRRTGSPGGRPRPSRRRGWRTGPLWRQRE